MNFKLLEQWLVEILCEQHKPHMHSLMECIQENSLLQFTTGMASLYPALVDPEIEISSAAANGFLMGICFAHGWKVDPAWMQHNLEGFLEYKRVKRGENVVNFFGARAGK